MMVENDIPKRTHNKPLRQMPKKKQKTSPLGFSLLRQERPPTPRRTRTKRLQTILLMQRLFGGRTEGTIMFMIGMTVLLFGFNMHWIGLHNMDNCQNWDWLEGKYGLELYEKTTNGKTVTPDQCYLAGYKQAIKSVFIIIAGAFSIGYGVAKIDR